jgi:protein-disulfide isomerase
MIVAPPHAVFMASDPRRRRFLQASGTAALAALAGCASVANQLSGGERDPSTATATDGGDVSTPADQSGTEGTGTEAWSPASVSIDEPDIDLASVPVPETRSPYAQMGQGSATTTATVYGNWKCPYTQEFVLQQLPEIVDRFVTPGELTVEFRSVAYMDGDPFLGPDAPRATRAGLAVWDIDPSAYWSFFAHVFANQPQERREWAQRSLLVRFAEESGVNGVPQVRQSITNGAYVGPTRTTARDAAELHVTSVPRLVVGGTVTAPTVDFQETLDELSRAVDG